MESIFRQPQPRCFGRYLIDMPEQLGLSVGGGQEVGGVRLVVAPMDQDTFHAVLLAKKIELERKILPGEERYPFLRFANALSGDMSGILFDRAASEVAASRMGRVLELMTWRHGYSITAAIDAIDTDFPEFANDAWIKESKTTTKEQSALLLDVVARTRGRDEFEVPPEKGLCILNGFVAGGVSATENVTMIFQLKSAPDVFFTLNSSSSNGRSDSLLERGRKAQVVITDGGGAIIRMGKYQNGAAMDGQELLYRILSDFDSEQKQIMTYKFAFEGNNNSGHAIEPLLSIELDVGERVHFDDASAKKWNSVPLNAAALTEPEAIALWDAVVPTIRPRVAGF